MNHKMYLVQNESLNLIPNYETFCAMNFTLHDIINFQIPKTVEKLPMGPDLPIRPSELLC